MNGLEDEKLTDINSVLHIAAYMGRTTIVEAMLDADETALTAQDDFSASWLVRRPSLYMKISFRCSWNAGLLWG